MKIRIIYGSDTGMTEDVTQFLEESLSWATEISVKEVHNISPEDFEGVDLLIFGLSTWYDGDLQSDWEDYYDEFKTIDFSDKVVAIYGLGDQNGYPDYFIDGVGMLAEVVIDNGGRIIGHWPSTEYDYMESKAKMPEKDYFYGLAIDEDNQPELTNARVLKWIDQLQQEYQTISNSTISAPVC